MLSSVLNSKTAIRVNIRIIRVFTKMREMLLTHKDILIQLQKIENRVDRHDTQIIAIFEHIRHLLSPPEVPRRKIGFRRKEEED